MRDLTARLENLTPEQREKLLKISKKRAATIPAPIPVLPRDSSTFPLSFAQQRLWFLSQFEPGGTQYHIHSAVQIDGALQVDVLERSLREIVRRHEVLRTIFVAVDGQSQQVIEPEVALTLPIVDLRALSTAERQAEVRRLAVEEALQPFDLARGPLFRSKLLRLHSSADQPSDTDEHVLLLTMHHIISDGWSQGVLIGELSTLYMAFAAKQPSPLPELPIQYADFAAWQRQRLQGPLMESQLTYWKSKFGGAPPVLQLPTDRPRPLQQTYNGAVETRVFSSKIVHQLKELTQQEGATLFMTLLAAFQILLARYSGQDDIAIGTPIANRNRAELEGLIGFFVNTLVLRTDLSDNPSFRELLQRVREVCLEAYAHQDLPFEQLVNVLHPARDLSHTPLFQVMLVLQNTPPVAEQGPQELRLSALPIESGVTKFDLTLTLLEHTQGLGASLEYNTDLFDAATIIQLLDHFEVLLAGIGAMSDRPISHLPLLTPEQRADLAGRWPGAPGAFSVTPGLAARFEWHAAQTPAAIALTYEHQQLSYAQLNARANQLAHLLRDLGVGPDTLVALCLERSLDLVVAVLAVIKAGGAYVPLDPAAPDARLAFSLTDTRAPVLLSQSALASRLDALCAPLASPPTVLCLDALDARLALAPTANLPIITAPDHLAYVIYTSGSTGQPKGVLITHANVVRLFTATAAWFGFGPHDVWTLFHSYAFDFSVWELWGALLFGGQLVVTPFWVSRAPDAFAALLQQEGVTVLNQTPSAFRQLLAVAAPTPTLRLIIFGGEALDLASLQAWYARHDATGPQLVNMYGITETTVHVTYQALTAQQALLAPGSLIGGPIPDLRLAVLDADGEPVPEGVVGELYVGGAGVARGYLQRPDLTAERFVPDPFSAEPGARWYRTGDLARVRRASGLEYIGRADQQVKVRGFRIELGEIASALRTHAAVQESVVVVREDTPGSKRLVAYCVLAAGAAVPSADAWRAHLAARLPEYMVPAVVVLDALPLTRNGKLDQAALPRPEAQEPTEAAARIAPRTAVEATLAEIWGTVLGVATVGVEDNFFTLGGDSILSIQIVARAAQAGLHLTPKQLFEHQSIAALAQVVATAVRTTAEQGVVTGDAPLTPIQHWFFDQEQPEPHHWNQAVLLSVRGRLDRAALRATIAALLRHHDALRLRFTPTTDGWQQQCADVDADVPLTVIDLTTTPEDARADVLAAEAEAAQASLDLQHGPLLRAVYFDAGAALPGRLLLVVHHLAVDGVSWRILLDDLHTAYTQLQAGQSVALPAKTTAFITWAEQLQAFAHASTLAEELPVWLHDERQWIAPLPVDMPDGSNIVDATRTVVATLDSAETRALLQDVPGVYHTQINDVLLTTLAQTLAAWIGESRLLIGLEGHGREELFADVDLSRTVGWFTSLYPLMLTLPFNGDPGTMLKAVKEQLHAVPQKGIGYGLLRYMSADPKVRAQLIALPQAEISFNYLGQFDQTFSSAELFTLASEPSGSPQNPRQHRAHLIDVNGSIVGGQLQLSWSYSHYCYHRETIEGLAQNYLQMIRTLIAHCQSPDVGGFTPSDFPDAELSQNDLDTLMQKLSRRKA